jgi:hypothetical protein
VIEGEPLNYYIMPGSSFVLEMKASDGNTLDNITIEIDKMGGLLPGYLTENMYEDGECICMCMLSMGICRVCILIMRMSVCVC